MDDPAITVRPIGTMLVAVAVLAAATVSPAARPLAAQQPARGEAEAARAVTRLVAEPASLTVQAGQTVPLRVTAYDAQGNVVADAPMRVSGPRMTTPITRLAKKSRRRDT